MVKTAGISTQSSMIREKKCEYFLFDFIPRDLRSSAAVQNYIGEELGLPTSCIIIGSQLPRGVWEAWIDKRMNLARVFQLPRQKHCRVGISLKILLPNRLRTQDGNYVQLQNKSHSMSLNGH
jgi:hypothetical protein